MIVEITSTHNWYDGDLNDNEIFMDDLNKLNKYCDESQCVEEYFNNVVWVYRLGEEYHVYFTVEHTVNEIDGYIMKSMNLENLFDFIVDKRKSYVGIKDELLELCTI